VVQPQHLPQLPHGQLSFGRIKPSSPMIEEGLIT
jgi:hypothetical protein